MPSRVHILIITSVEVVSALDRQETDMFSLPLLCSWCVTSDYLDRGTDVCVYTVTIWFQCCPSWV